MSNCIYCKGCNIFTQCIGNYAIIYENDNSFPYKDITTLNNECYLNLTRNIYFSCYYTLKNCKEVLKKMILIKKKFTFIL